VVAPSGLPAGLIVVVGAVVSWCRAAFEAVLSHRLCHDLERGVLLREIDRDSHASILVCSQSRPYWSTVSVNRSSLTFWLRCVRLIVRFPIARMQARRGRSSPLQTMRPAAQAVVLDYLLRRRATMGSVGAGP
jgi:hypothetical protein